MRKKDLTKTIKERLDDLKKRVAWLEELQKYGVRQADIHARTGVCRPEISKYFAGLGDNEEVEQAVLDILWEKRKEVKKCTVEK